MPHTDILIEGTEAPALRSLIEGMEQGGLAIHGGYVFHYAEAAPVVAFLPEPRSARRRRAAGLFAEQARSEPGVQDVRLLALTPELEVAVLLDTANLDRELGLRGSFVDVMRRELDVTEGELFVYAADDAIPPHVMGGQSLAH